MFKDEQDKYDKFVKDAVADAERLLQKTKKEAQKLESDSIRKIEKEITKQEKKLKDELKQAVDNKIEQAREKADAVIDKAAAKATEKANEKIDKGFNLINKFFGSKLIDVTDNQAATKPVNMFNFGRAPEQNKYTQLMQN